MWYMVCILVCGICLGVVWFVINAALVYNICCSCYDHCPVCRNHLNWATQKIHLIAIWGLYIRYVFIVKPIDTYIVCMISSISISIWVAGVLESSYADININELRANLHMLTASLVSLPANCAQLSRMFTSLRYGIFRSVSLICRKSLPFIKWTTITW